jgi:Uncharacterized protein conserved in bacteria
MRHLLDAHTLIWALDDPSRLGASAKAILENPATELTVSIGTIWELSIKTSLKKLSLSLPYRQWVERALADLGVTVSPITLEFTERRIVRPMALPQPLSI